LQFKAFSEIGIALGSRIKKHENRVNAFKYYLTKDLFPKPDIDYYIDSDRFTNIGMRYLGDIKLLRVLNTLIKIYLIYRMQLTIFLK
jgi:hypothetical protein